MSERTLLSLLLMLTVAGFVALGLALGPVARTAPLVVGIPTLALVAVTVWRDARSALHEIEADDGRRLAAHERQLGGWLTLLVGLTALAGVPAGLPLWFLAFLRYRSRESWKIALTFSSGLLVALLAVFTMLLHIDPMSGSVLTWLL